MWEQDNEPDGNADNVVPLGMPSPALYKSQALVKEVNPRPSTLNAKLDRGTPVHCGVKKITPETLNLNSVSSYCILNPKP